jgi:hypothetical protein
LNLNNPGYDSNNNIRCPGGNCDDKLSGYSGDDYLPQLAG